MAAVAYKLPGRPARASFAEREAWMRARQAQKLTEPRRVRTHARGDYCGACRDCRALDAWLASGDQTRMPWPAADERGHMQSSWAGIVEHLALYGAPLTTPGYASQKRASQQLGERREPWEVNGI